MLPSDAAAAIRCSGASSPSSLASVSTAPVRLGTDRDEGGHRGEPCLWIFVLEQADEGRDHFRTEISQGQGRLSTCLGVGVAQQLAECGSRGLSVSPISPST